MEIIINTKYATEYAKTVFLKLRKRDEDWMESSSDDDIREIERISHDALIVINGALAAITYQAKQAELLKANGNLDDDDGIGDINSDALARAAASAGINLYYPAIQSINEEAAHVLRQRKTWSFVTGWASN